MMRTWAILAAVLLFFGFSVFHASWLAGTPEGIPKLIAARGAEPTRDTQGCASGPSANDIGSLAMAVGNQADALNMSTQVVGGQLVIGPQYESTCASDKSRSNSQIGEAVYALSKPELLWRAKGADQAAMLLAALPAPGKDDKQGMIGDDAAVAAFKKARPNAWAFSIPAAQACASDYKLSGLWGSIPESCKQGTMLLTMDQVGYTLWGWPNRFLARTDAAGLKVVIAESVEGDKIVGLTDVNRYGDIANSFNGYIWIDDIEGLGPALKR
jgi:glycerophosphoryl diester phosphodiesterase